MKVLLIGNYPHDRQESMQRFAASLHAGLTQAGHDVRLVVPEPVIGRLKPASTGIGKWLGYADRFVLFRKRLRAEIAWADVVHICDQGNAVYVPWLNGRPHVVTCHDVLAIRSALGEVPANVTGRSGRIYQRWIVSGLRKAQHVACVSGETRAELIRAARIIPERVTVVPMGLNYPYRPMAVREARALLDGRIQTMGAPFFLHVGGNQWYKNRPGVVRIFKRLTERPGFDRHHLIMAGKPWPPELRALVQRTGLPDRIHEVTEASNEELRALYSLAVALIYPSLHEGFGWPIIEAQACGCLVVTSNRPPMTDVAGEGAVFVNPEDEDGAAAAIDASVALRESFIAAGSRNAGCYSAASMVDRYLSTYRLVRSAPAPS